MAPNKNTRPCFRHEFISREAFASHREPIPQVSLEEVIALRNFEQDSSTGKMSPTRESYPDCDRGCEALMSANRRGKPGFLYSGGQSTCMRYPDCASPCYRHDARYWAGGLQLSTTTLNLTVATLTEPH
jgi:hypothetical protein